MLSNYFKTTLFSSLLVSAYLSGCSDLSSDTNNTTSLNNQSTIIETPSVATSEEKSLLNKGMEHWQNKDFQKAEQSFRQAIDTNPKLTQAYTLLAGLFLSQNMTDKAIPLYQEAISLTPDNPKLFSALSIAYLHQSQYSMASAMADEALKLAPEMEQVKKIQTYIEKKQDMIQLASKVDIDQSIQAGKPPLKASTSSHKTDHLHKSVIAETTQSD